MIYANFEMNRNFIAQNLCLKKDIQNNTCLGNCYLKKQLDKAEKQEQKQLPQSQKEKLEVLYFQNITNFNGQENQYIEEPIIFPSNSTQHYKTPYHIGIFQPPELT
jgi:hypothetical protein